MAQTVSILLFPEDRARLAAVIGDRNNPQKHMQRAQIVLHSAEKRSVLDVARRSGVSRPAVWRWQRRYAEHGVDIRRGVFKSVAELEDAIKRYIADHNRNAKPFVWTKTADEIFEKLSRLPAPSK